MIALDFIHNVHYLDLDDESDWGLAFLHLSTICFDIVNEIV